MFTMKKLFATTFLAFATVGFASAQETFSMVYEILETRCGGNGCHNGTTPTFDVTQTEAELYADLVNADPINPTAAAKGNKLIMPG